MDPFLRDAVQGHLCGLAPPGKRVGAVLSAYFEAAANLRQQLTNYLRESSAVRAPGDDYRRAGQMDFRDYDENDEEF